MNEQLLTDGRRRVIIDSVQPEVGLGRFPVKRTVGQDVAVQVDAFTDSHDILECRLRYRHTRDTVWQEVIMGAQGDDRWQASFHLEELGQYAFTISAWIDHFVSWRNDFVRRTDAQDQVQSLGIGVQWIEEAAARAEGDDQKQLRKFARKLHTLSPESGSTLVRSDLLSSLMRHYSDRSLATDYPHLINVWSEPLKAQYSTWYELFPRSCVGQGMEHGTFTECRKRLPDIAAMGFDVVYFPPIHPIGVTQRRGPNNSPQASATDVGSPWAIGAAAGGHTSIHPQLGTLDDFHQLVTTARELGIDIALDLAFQCSPDHPYVLEHPEWFRHRADGTIQYAENPPKKYEDIVPFDFETAAWRELWQALREVVLFWIRQGVTVFRVDNPHTKPFPFWEWLIGDIKALHPETIFLAEAFARPKVAYRLAQVGFSQSYTYFIWRNSKRELETYFTQLTHTTLRHYFRPNLWPNSPDILATSLQFGGRAGFMLRLVLAATLGANYGIYGPAYELMEALPRTAGSEEYLDSEKYQVRHWDLDRGDSLRDFITRVNRIRRDNAALQQDHGLQFFDVTNDSLLCYAKFTPDKANIILVVVNLDPHHTQSGWVTLALDSLGLEIQHSYQVQDLLTAACFLWNEARNYVEINPQVAPAHIFKLRRRVRTEHDFDYFL